MSWRPETGFRTNGRHRMMTLLKYGLTKGAVVATLSIGIAVVSTPVRATLADCGGGTTSSNGVCNLVVTFGLDGSVITTVPDGATTNYDGTEDALIGVVNNTANTLNGFHLTGTDIGGFEVDGIDTFITGAENPGNPDTTGYGGPIGYFTSNTGGALDVNFYGGVAAGGTTYFSLEGAADPLMTVDAVDVPEPAGLALFGVGLIGLYVARRRLISPQRPSDYSMA